MAILNRFSAILFYCDSTYFCASRCGISGDSRPAILGIMRFVRSTSNSIFYRIIRAGIGVLCLLGLTSLRVQNLDTTTPSLPVLFVSNERQHLATLYDTILHYFVWKYATARGGVATWDSRFAMLCRLVRGVFSGISGTASWNFKASRNALTGECLTPLVLTPW